MGTAGPEASRMGHGRVAAVVEDRPRIATGLAGREQSRRKGRMSEGERIRLTQYAAKSG